MTEKLPEGWKRVKLGEVDYRITSGETPSTEKEVYYNWFND